MNKKLNILYCSPEVTPFSKTGGLADVAGSLPKALTEIGCNVKVITPGYAASLSLPLKFIKILEALPVSIGDRSEVCGLYESNLPESNVPVYFLSNEKYFKRNGLYQKDGHDYDDNLDRFSFFSMAVLYSIKKLGWVPDIIHCNDWQTALIPVYLNSIVKEDKDLLDFYKNSGSLFTIHNLGYQGLFDKDKFPLTGIRWTMFNINGLEFFGKINLIKGGVIFSDIINTVSPAYSREIQTEEEGYGLHGVLQERKKDLYGILNGVDYKEWDPSIDKHIVSRYSLKSISRKKRCKEDLQENCNLTIKDVPLVGIVSRLDDQKGFDILIGIIGELMQLDIQIVILGSGKPKYQDILKMLAAKYPYKISVNLFFGDTLAHKIEAGADIFLIPSKYEPCGLSQLYSFRYGTVPVAHKTGGLADTITDFTPSNIIADKATGFLFSHYKAEDLLKAILLALSVYRDKTQWKRLMVAGMKSDFSWKRSAGEYVKLYKKILVKIKNQK